MESNVLSVIGFFFTLVSLLGSFFYIHLATWYRDIIDLDFRYKQNEEQANDQQKDEVRQCRYDYKKLFSNVPIYTSIILTLFLGLISVLSFKLLIPHICKEQLALYLAIALSVFILIYITLVSYFIIRGLLKKRELTVLKV